VKYKPHYRRLIWNPDGYRPVGYEWGNYVSSNNSYALRHDLFEHQLGESGTMPEEFRAVGAKYRFAPEVLTENVGTHAKFWYLALKRYVNLSRSIKEVEAPDFLGNFVFYELGLPNPQFWLHLLVEGYNNALTFPKEAWEKMKNENFKIYHKNHKNLVVDLNKGIVVKATNSKEAREFLLQSAQLSQIQENKISTREGI